MMTVREAVNRGLNFFATAVLAILASDTVYEAVSEDEWTDKVDDVVLAAIVIGAIVWYLRGRNRYTRSFVPLIFMIFGGIIEIAGLLVERDDTQAVGPDIGVVLYMALAILVVAWQLWNTRKSRTTQTGA